MWIPDHERRAPRRNTRRIGCERVNGGGNGRVLSARDANLDDCDRGREGVVPAGDCLRSARLGRASAVGWLCGCAVVRLCGCAVVQSCSHAVMQSCGYAAYLHVAELKFVAHAGHVVDRIFDTPRPVDISVIGRMRGETIDCETRVCVRTDGTNCAIVRPPACLMACPFELARTARDASRVKAVTAAVGACQSSASMVTCGSACPQSAGQTCWMSAGFAGRWWPHSGSPRHKRRAPRQCPEAHRATALKHSTQHGRNAHAARGAPAPARPAPPSRPVPAAA